MSELGSFQRRDRRKALRPDMGLWPDNHRLLWVLSRLQRLSSLTLAAAQSGGSLAERMFLSYMDLARLSCPELRRLTADVATENSSNNVWLPRDTPRLESCTVRLGLAHRD